MFRNLFNLLMSNSGTINAEWFWRTLYNLFLFCINAKKERDNNVIFPFRNVYLMNSNEIARVRDPSVQLGSAQHRQLVTAQGIPINQAVLWSTKSRKKQGRRWQRGEVTSVPRVWRSPSQRDLSPSWTNSPRLIKYGALSLVTRRRQREGRAWVFTYMQICILKHRYQPRPATMGTTCIALFSIHNRECPPSIAR